MCIAYRTARCVFPPLWTSSPATPSRKTRTATPPPTDSAKAERGSHKQTAKGTAKAAAARCDPSIGHSTPIRRCPHRAPPPRATNHKPENPPNAPLTTNKSRKSLVAWAATVLSAARRRAVPPVTR